MILPTKHLSAESCLLGMGAQLVQNSGSGSTLSQLWERAKRAGVPSYEQFVLSMDLLYLLGLVQLDGRRVRISP